MTVSLTAVSGVALAASSGGSAHAASASAGATLKTGSTGRAVKALQRRLHVSVTGYFGSATKRAVQRFQRAHGLVADGVAGPATLSKLGVRVRQASASTGGASPTAPTHPSALLERIARCESGGNPRAVSANGQYRGKYQFDRATWKRWGGKGDPAAAPEAVQDRIALKLYRARGTAPWPNCA